MHPAAWHVEPSRDALRTQVKDQASGGYLFNLEAWHQKLLPAAQAFMQSQGTPSSLASTVAARR